MSEPSDVVDRADTLMRRRRSFVAAPVVRPQPVNATQNVVAGEAAPRITGEDDDLPVLTEVLPAEASVFEERDDRFDETQVSLLAADIAHAIGQQLTCDLPSLIEAALLNAGEELRNGISATLETALNDFIARRKQLRLPLDEPGRDD